LDLKESKTLGEGRGNAFIVFLKEGRAGDCPSEADWKLQIGFGNFRGNYTGKPIRSRTSGFRLRKLLEEDDRKAVFGKTECTV